MGLRKGQTNNLNGRPPDAKVKSFRDAIRDKQIDRLEQAYKELDALKDSGREKDYIDLYLRLNKEAFPPLPAEMEKAEMERTVMSIFEMVTAKKDEYEEKKLKAIHKESQVV